MRKQEQKLWDRMRKGLNGSVYLERVENVVNPGRPDVDVMWGGVTLPIELKAISAWPSRSETPVLGRGKGLNQNQLNWWFQWARSGGRGFILVSVDGDTFAVPGELSDQVNRFTAAHFSARRVTWAEFLVQIKREAQCVRKP